MWTTGVQDMIHTTTTMETYRYNIILAVPLICSCDSGPTCLFSLYCGQYRNMFVSMCLTDYKTKQYVLQPELLYVRYTTVESNILHREEISCMPNVVQNFYVAPLHETQHTDTGCETAY